jgi:hypothetical protein
MRTLVLSLAICVSFIAGLSQNATAQIGTDDVIISEFFDDILRVNQGSVTDIFDIPDSMSDNITHMAIANPTTLYVVNFSEVWKIDTAANSVDVFATVLGVTPSELKIDLDGNLVLSSASEGVIRIDATTGVQTTIYDDAFFDPSDIVISDTGNIYTTEFFDGLGRISPSGAWNKIGDWDTDFFQKIDIGPDGFLYAATTFEGGDIYRINPVSGTGTVVADDAFAFVDDIAVASDGLIYLAGNADFDGDDLDEDLIFTINPLTGERLIVVDETEVGNPTPPFFNPQDIEIFNGFFSVVPEPGSGLVLIGLGFVVLSKRRRN